MYAYELLNRLTYLTLVSGDFGDDIFVGDTKDWNKVMWADDGVPAYQPERTETPQPLPIEKVWEHACKLNREWTMAYQALTGDVDLTAGKHHA